MTIDRRVRVTTGIGLLFVVIMGSILIWSSNEVENGLNQLELSSQVVRSAFLLRSLTDEYLAHGDSRPLRQWSKRYAFLGRTINEAKTIQSFDQARVRILENEYKGLNSLHSQIVQLESSDNQPQNLKALKEAFSGMMSVRLEELVNAAEHLHRDSQSLTLRRQELAQALILVTALVMVGIIVFSLYLIRQSIVQPLLELSKGAERIGEGDFERIAEAPNKDEVGKLAQAFNTMVERLKATRDALQAETEERSRAQDELRRMNDELEIRVHDRTVALTKAKDELELTVEERTAALETVQTQNELLHAVTRAQTEFISQGSPETLFEDLLHDLLALTNSDFGFIGEILNTEDGQMYLRDRAISDISWDEESRKVYRQFAEDKGLDFVNIRGLCGATILTGEPVISNDPANDPRSFPPPEGHPPMHSFLGIPLHLEGKVIGMAGLANRSGGYDAELLAFLRPYIITCANIIEAYRNENRRREAVQLLAQAHADLEQKVLDRTAELGSVNERLVVEIEERKRAEQVANVERQRLYNVMETLPVYVCLLDSDYNMPFANRYFREVFAEPRGRRCYDFLFNLTEPCEICETYTVMKTGEPHHWYWTGPNGRDYDIYDFPFIDADGARMILEMGIDITERNRAEEALKQTLADLTRSNADLEQFAYVASHDLQEPLRNVISCMQLLEKRYKNSLGQDADRFMYYAVESATRMKGLIQDLLAYSRISTRGRSPQQVDCEEIFERTLLSLRSAAKEASAVITHDPLPSVSADPTQLTQIFQNLVGNAIKFRGQETPQIHVSAARDGVEWIFSVKDNGIGIESQHLERIFVIFQRLNKGTEYEGTGMGLAIVKKVVERHRGRVWVESEPGRGATFYFTIPANENILR